MKGKWDYPPIGRVNYMDAVVHVDYVAHLDAKKRVTIRGAKYSYYQEKDKRISAKTLKMMDDSIKNFHQCKVSAPIYLSEF